MAVDQKAVVKFNFVTILKKIDYYGKIYWTKYKDCA